MAVMDQWLADIGPTTCETCIELDGHLFPPHQGPVPPLHPHCRCIRRRVNVPGTDGTRWLTPDGAPLDATTMIALGIRSRPDPETGAADDPDDADVDTTGHRQPYWLQEASDAAGTWLQDRSDDLADLLNGATGHPRRPRRHRRRP